MDNIKKILEKFRNAGKIAAYSMDNPQAGRQVIRLDVIGKRSPDLAGFLEEQRSGLFEVRDQAESYHFLGGELRPGSGIVRSFGGRPEGPGGTLTCFLSSKDGRDLYFVGAGHVVSNFWAPGDSSVSVYRRRQGYPGTNSSRYLGKAWAVSDPPPSVIHNDDYASIDVGIVELRGEFELKARTTCYGNMGEWFEEPTVSEGDLVMKCGAEETHWTTAMVEAVRKSVWVYGRPSSEGLEQKYLLVGQIILTHPEGKSRDGCRECRKNQVSAARRQIDGVIDLPENSPRIPFAVPGDSGTMVVDSETKRPIGMLVAGDVIAGKYVVTPFTSIARYWSSRDPELVLLRA